jgi:hypothetical protein
LAGIDVREFSIEITNLLGGLQAYSKHGGRVKGLLIKFMKESRKILQRLQVREIQ